MTVTNMATNSRGQSEQIDAILKKLHAISSEVGEIEKDAKNDFHGYSYASEHAIKAAIKPLLVKHGVLFSLDTTNQQLIEIPSKNGKQPVMVVNFRYYFYDSESGQFLSGVFSGSGADTGDKGIYKAVTGAIKYILTSTFLIPTGAGDDPEFEKAQKSSHSGTQSASQDTGKQCQQCGSAMKLREGSKGWFWGCTSYPNCTWTEPYEGDA